MFLVSIIDWLVKIFIAVVLLLLLALLISFLWTAIITNLLKGPAITFFDVALICAIVSVGLSSWTFAIIRHQGAQPPS